MSSGNPAGSFENFVGIYNLINSLGPAFDERRWDELATRMFTDDAPMTHTLWPVAPIGGHEIVSRAKARRTTLLASQQLAGNIRIQPSSGDTGEAEWDNLITQFHAGTPEPIMASAGTRLKARFKRIDGEWRIAQLTVSILWLDPALQALVKAQTGSVRHFPSRDTQ